MVFHPNHCSLNDKVVNAVADDIIEIAEISRDKQRLRALLIQERLAASNKQCFLTAYEIRSMTSALSRYYVSDKKLIRVIKTINKNLKRQYNLLINLIGGIEQCH